MIKHFFLNKRRIPVPVPIRNLEELLYFVQDNLLKADQVITKILVNGHDAVETMQNTKGGYQGVELSQTSNVELQVDSPVELAIQTLETFKNLAMIAERSLKALAISLWQTPSHVEASGLTSLVEDLDMINELYLHFMSLQPISADQVKRLSELAAGIEQIKLTITAAISHSDWRGAARILLNQLEPVLQDLSHEAGSIQGAIYAERAEQMLRAKSATV